MLKRGIKAFCAVAFALLCVSFSAAPLHGQVIDIAKEYVYIEKDIDTAETAHVIGLEQAKRLVFDELAALLMVDNRFKRFHLPKGKIISFVAGIVIPEIANEKRGNRRYSFKIRAVTSYDELLNFIGMCLNEREKAEELEETGKNIEQILKEIIKLQTEIAPGRINREKKVQYRAATAQLNQEQWLEKGYALRNKYQYEGAIEVFDKAIAFKAKPIIMKEEANTATVASSAHLRSQPSRSSSQDGYVVKGTSLLILGESKDSSGGIWYRIKLPVSKKEAWIAEKTVKREKQDIQTGDYGMYSIARAYMGKGSVYLQSGKPDRAIDNYTKAIELSPHSAAAYNNRGFVYAELEDFLNAKKDLDYAVHLEPRNESAYLNRGRLHARSGNFEEAIKDYDRVLTINPESGIAYTGRGVNFAALKRYEKALKDLNAAIGLNPKDTDALYSRGTVYLNINEIDKAVEDYKIAARLGDKDAQAYLRGKGIPWDEKR